MNNPSALPSDAIAERIVRHFQAEGFVGIGEATLLRVALRRGERAEIEAAFRLAGERGRPAPVGDFFTIRPCGHFSVFRDFEAARAALPLDFTPALRMALPAIFFDPPPLVIDDPLATGTKYDAMLKLGGNVGDFAFAILLNDPDSSFFEYLGTHHGDNWGQIMGDFGSAALSFGQDIDLG